MSTIMPVIAVDDIPSPGALLGTSGSANVIAAIQDSFGSSSYFGSAQDPFREINNAFIRNVVTPIRELSAEVREVTNALLRPNVFRPLETIEDFRHIPDCMKFPVIMHPPLRRLLKQGRISGFGYDEDELPTEDVYGRLISNGVIEDILLQAGNKRYLDLNYVWCGDDPEITLDEIEHVERTRIAIDFILETSLIDPTDPSSERG